MSRIKLDIHLLLLKTISVMQYHYLFKVPKCNGLMTGHKKSGQ